MFVSVSAFNDADLLAGCLESVYEALGEAVTDIQVVDGRYETFPAPTDNSTDRTPEVAAQFDADYRAAGPFEREAAKHEYRVDAAPDGRRALFLDADERVVCADTDDLTPGVAYQPRIFNPVVYSDGTPLVYWPRSFYPETVVAVEGWDAYRFGARCERTDRITIVHRHDLRSRDYRERKYVRIAENEGRDVRYTGDGAERYYANDFEAEIDARLDGECPRCGGRVVESPASDYGDGFTTVRACIGGDCWATVREREVEDWQYLPDAWETGVREDPARLRIELIQAGCEFVRPNPPAVVERMAPAIGLWIDRHFDGDPSEVRA